MTSRVDRKHPHVWPYKLVWACQVRVCRRILLTCCVPVCLCASGPVWQCASVPVCLCACVPACLRACVPVVKTFILYFSYNKWWSELYPVQKVSLNNLKQNWFFLTLGFDMNFHFRKEEIAEKPYRVWHNKDCTDSLVCQPYSLSAYDAQCQSWPSMTYVYCQQRLPSNYRNLLDSIA